MLKRLLLLVTILQFAGLAQGQEADCAQWLNLSVNKLHTTESIDLCRETAGKPVLIVNTASYCGYTYQFTGLERLYQRYREQGLVVVGFPSDDFNQEDDDAARTAEICYVNHGVTFAMSEVVKVTGADAHPVFQHLNSATRQPDWNFNKYLIDRNGTVVGNFRSGVEPDSRQLSRAIEAVL
ncbi:MAG: glutathione peroxidase [Pseudohongiellaceae bacterium]